jgi:hypothetical protein
MRLFVWWGLARFPIEKKIEMENLRVNQSIPPVMADDLLKHLGVSVMRVLD